MLGHGERSCPADPLAPLALQRVAAGPHQCKGRTLPSPVLETPPLARATPHHAQQTATPPLATPPPCPPADSLVTAGGWVASPCLATTGKNKPYFLIPVPTPPPPFGPRCAQIYINGLPGPLLPQLHLQLAASRSQGPALTPPAPTPELQGNRGVPAPTLASGFSLPWPQCLHCRDPGAHHSHGLGLQELRGCHHGEVGDVHEDVAPGDQWDPDDDGQRQVSGPERRVRETRECLHPKNPFSPISLPEALGTAAPQGGPLSLTPAESSGIALKRQQRVR